MKRLNTRTRSIWAFIKRPEGVFMLLAEAFFVFDDTAGVFGCLILSNLAGIENRMRQHFKMTYELCTILADYLERGARR